MSVDVSTLVRAAVQHDAEEAQLILAVGERHRAPALAFHHRMQQAVSSERRIGGASDRDPRLTGRSSHDGMSVTRRPDQLSPMLYGACASGERLPEVSLWVMRTLPAPTPVPVVWLRIVLREVLITEVVTSRAVPGEGVSPGGTLETLTMDYGTITWIHEPGCAPSAATEDCPTHDLPARVSWARFS